MTKKLKLWINSIVLTLAIMAITVLAYYISTRHTARYDFSKNKINTLSPEMSALLTKLDKNVTVVSLFEKGSVQDSKIRDLMTEITRRQKKIQFQAVDPVVHPGVAKQLQMVDVGIHFQSGKKKKIVYQDELFEAPNQYTGEEGAFKGEQAVYNAIVAVAMKKNVMLCFTEGHSERGFSDSGAEGLANIVSLTEGESYAVSPLNIIDNKGIDKRCGILIIAGPRKPFTQFEVEEIEKFAGHGGKIFALVDPLMNSGLEPVLAKFGITLDGDIVIDPGSPFGQDASELRPRYLTSPITDKLMKDGLTINMLWTRSVNVNTGGGAQVTPLLESSGDAWAEKSMDQYPKKDKGDKIGPLTLAAASEAGKGNKALRAVVVGDSDFISNLSLSVVAQMSENAVSYQRGGTGNSDFFLNALSWLGGEEKLISIRPKSLDYRPLNLDGNTKQLISYIFTFAVPLVIIVLGGVIWNRRRSL